MRRGRNGKRIRPNKASSKRTRRAELVAFVRMAVKIGTPVESLTDLSKLLDPTIVEAVIEAYWRKDVDLPVYVIDLGWKLLRQASSTGAVDEVALQRLDDIRASLEEYRRQRSDAEKQGAGPSNSGRWGLEASWSTCHAFLMAEARAALDQRARQGCRHGAAGGRNRDSHPRADPLAEPGLHFVGHASDQTGQLRSAVLSALRSGGGQKSS